ncbi:MAG: DUF1330 domain-containing protein [Myxococcota bacterium]
MRSAAVLVLLAACGGELSSDSAASTAQAQAETPVESLVGVMIEDAETYAEYRLLLAPVLDAHGAELIFEVRVDEVLRARDNERFNRLFLMRFPSASAAQRFSQNAEYLSLRERLFDPSVSNTVFWARYPVPPR